MHWDLPGFKVSRGRGILDFIPGLVFSSWPQIRDGNLIYGYKLCHMTKVIVFTVK